ncbi:hypothetical protein L195_g017548 [Trifolium pratense]|uniref:Uncharacterized protein n=1 Tax=Trifolium pratense TaxID=57577 RepID=A0A2K3MU71_TRIPR|nr:hypothetical protein L195_g017548 [Trifolium pratense]
MPLWCSHTSLSGSSPNSRCGTKSEVDNLRKLLKDTTLREKGVVEKLRELEFENMTLFYPLVEDPEKHISPRMFPFPSSKVFP